MSEFVTSPSMNLPIPIVGSCPGPDYAALVDNCLSIIDGHTHAFGSGVQIQPDGLNINSDLTIQGNNLTNVKSLIFSSQPSALPGSSPYLGALYEVLNDLYYNDGIGNQIRLTQGGSIVGTSGSITGLVSPASATYNPGSSTFTWQSGVSTPATMDMGNIIIRNDTASSPGITIAPNASIAGNYQITLPAALPGATEFVTLDSSGNLTATVPIIQGIAQSMLAPRATGSTVVAGGYATGTSSGGFFTTSATPTQITGCTITITTTGRPVRLQLQGIPTGSNAYVSVSNTASEGATGHIAFYSGSTLLNSNDLGCTTDGVNDYVSTPPSAFSYIDTPAAGTYTYHAYAAINSGNGQITVNNCTLTAYEL